MSQSWAVPLAAAGLATTLTGCCIPFTGGCASKTTSTTSTTTTTSTVTFPPKACQSGASICADYLNSMYYGFDESASDSPLGVPLRGRTIFKEDEYWFFCSNQCYQTDGTAFADCNVQSSLINHKVMFDHASGQPLYAPGQESDYAYSVFAIFYEDIVREKLTRCAYQYDGATFSRGNGGCGLGMGGHNCDDPVSAFQGHCPDEGKQERFACEEVCEATQQAWCGSEVHQGKQYPESNCFWKGPAYQSPSFPGAEVDLSVLGEPNEFREMLKQRIASQDDGQTPDGISYQTYWNELVIDGRVLTKLLETDPASVVAAWAYRIDGSPSDAVHLEEAKKFRDEHYTKYGVSVPLISLDVRKNVLKREPLFAAGPEDPTTTGSPEAPQMV